MGLDTLRPGDQVIFVSWFGAMRLVRVERITKTRIVTECSLSFSKRHGGGVGSYNYSRIMAYEGENVTAYEEFIAEQREKKERTELTRKISNALGKLSIPQLRSIAEVIDQQPIKEQK